VTADIEQSAIDAAVADLGSAGGRVMGLPHRRQRSGIGTKPCRQGLRRPRCLPRVVQQRRGRGAQFKSLGDHAERFALGIRGECDWGSQRNPGFVPRMLDAGLEGHIVNTSSPDGPISPLSTASVYAASKAAVSMVTERLAAQLESDGTALRASLFYPSGGLAASGAVDRGAHSTDGAGP
jgi:NAD(P)-dependent dehydrogenase (short-subunit alcohol dehydrogenase family)